ncbi:MAG TPA: helix-turn-helix domain-containing protein [Chthoniobacteraceae bacterium]|jgi:cytoskeletal protein RodZ|nr:helix-turn-helix domain-containing protein [Chthoniobacteraceae bacterium]
MVNTVGKRLQQARIAKQLSVEEAARVTRIRPDKLIDLEEDNYSNFPSMSYAKGFLLLYARFLGVDVRDFAESLHTPNPVSTDDYEYLNAAADAPPPPPTRRPYHFRPQRQHSILPIIVFCVLAGAVALGVYLVVTVQRLGPLDQISDKNASPSATPAISTLPPARPAASAMPVSTPALRGTPPVIATGAARPAPPAPAATPAAAPAPTAAAPASTPVPAATFDPSREVRRAEPVFQPSPPQTSASAPPAAVGSAPDLTMVAPASPSATPDTVKEVAIRPVRKTWVTIRKDVADSPPFFQDWLYPGDPPLKLTGHKFWIQVEDPTSIEVTQDGQPLPAGQSDIQIE